MSIKYNGKTIAGGYTPPYATDNIYGITRIATDDELKEGLSKTTCITPYQLSNHGEKVFSNVSLSNLDIEGEKHFINKSQITNCLLEVPQRIKYTLENGTLTIHKGSVVIVPYGIEDLSATYPVGATFINDNFKVYDTQYTEDADGNGKFFVWVELVGDIIRDATSSSSVYERLMYINITGNGTNGTIENTSGSGDTSSTSTNYNHYNTTTNLIVCKSSGVIKDVILSLPIFKYLSDTTYNVATVTQVFNGMGYIGAVKWLDKGVKMLLSDGFNADGTYKSIEYTQPELITYTGGTANATYNVTYHPNDIVSDFNISVSQVKYTFEVDNLSDVSITDTSFGVAYVRNENRFYVHVANTDWTPVKGCRISFHYNSDTNGTVGTLNPKLPFRAVDYNEFVTASYIVQNYVSGTSWYRVWSDGWIEQGGRVSLGNGAKTTISLLKQLSNTNYGALATGSHSSSTGACFIFDKTISSFVLKNSANTSDDTTWYAYGY